ncbi:hypothetical protein SmJEL517_g04148 [Synchytrium microbalum]|uniref:Glucose-methanol-choline oxidoreductase N-terminal domain-containing protein n=1 Tax=Synchytrium microbalum TaxID=1806994 RepID=A0A507BZI3_9FUNG|nr:uncharacterized protein SmJEL517_g04148 [Synchytrium microbalum]TPX32842.1 hypothetical protein SmJEL517_g04148 [Synchytrium microbalum]
MANNQTGQNHKRTYLYVLRLLGYAASSYIVIRGLASLGLPPFASLFAATRRKLSIEEEYERLFKGDFDYIVLGAGSAGCALASRLSEDPNCKVLLLEAGPDSKDMLAVKVPGLFTSLLGNYTTDWKLATVPQKDTFSRVHSLARGKLMGGCSAVNATVWVRGSPEDFEELERDYGNKGWGWDIMKRIYERVESVQIPKDHVGGGRGYDGATKISHSTNNRPAALHFKMVECANEAGIGSSPDGTSDTKRQVRLDHKTFGVDYNSENQFGSGILQSNVHNGERQSTAHSYIYPYTNPKLANYRPNLTVFSGVHVLKVLLEPNPKTGKLRADGVVVKISKDTTGTERKIRARKDIIASLGSIGSPQLLMLSGIGPKEHLKSVGLQCLKDLPGVGENLQDHLFSWLHVENLDKTVYTPRRTSFLLWSLLEWSLFRTGMFAGNVILESGSFFNTKKYVERQKKVKRTRPPPPNIQFHMGGSFQGDPNFVGMYSSAVVEPFAGSPSGFDAERAMSESMYLSRDQMSKVPDSSTIWVTFIKPQSRGTVRLRSANPFDKPIIDPKYVNHPDDIEDFADGFEDARRVVDKLQQKYPLTFGREVHDAWIVNELLRVHPEWSREKAAASREYIKAYIRLSCQNISHPTGTCAMKAEAAGGVIDSKCLVYGTENLRVVDASVFVNIPAGNTNAPTIAVAERAADIIRGI